MLFMTFNVRCGNANDGSNSWEFRYYLATGLVRELAPDILGLQEPLDFQVTAFADALPEYSWVGIGREDGASGGEYCPIYFRGDKFIASSHGTFWLSNTPDVIGSRSWGNRCVRICTWARLTEITSNREFYVYNCHLDHESQEARARAVDQILADISVRAEGLPVVWMGDFNAEESNPIIPVLAESLTDTYRQIHPEGAVRTFTGFDDNTPINKIDYIWCNRGFEVKSAAVIPARPEGRHPSDHEPVTAELVCSETYV